jgi:Domain of unknown function (DUF4279)
MPATQSPASPKSTYFPDEVAVALCIYGKELDPYEVSALLGVKPTHAHKIGERKSLKSPPYDKGAWILELRRFEPIDLDSMYEELLAPLPEDVLIWESLASRFEIRVDFAVHTDVGCGFHISPRTMKLIASKQAEFHIDIHAYGDNDA